MKSILPPNYDRLIAAVNDRDREYFAKHPKKKFYIRPYVPGELYPLMPPYCDQVKVHNIAPGVRSRQPLLLCDQVVPVRVKEGGLS
jgi:hypothetical protein